MCWNWKEWRKRNQPGIQFYNLWCGEFKIWNSLTEISQNLAFHHFHFLRFLPFFHVWLRGISSDTYIIYFHFHHRCCAGKNSHGFRFIFCRSQTSWYLSVMKYWIEIDIDIVITNMYLLSNHYHLPKAIISEVRDSIPLVLPNQAWS